MANYYLTFPQRYRREPHPFKEGANPDGYVVVKAYDKKHAREQVNELLGDAWSDLQSMDEFIEEDSSGRSGPDYYPAGCSGVLLEGRFTLTSDLVSSGEVS